MRRAGSELVLAASAAAVAPPLVDAPAEAGVAVEGRARHRFGRFGRLQLQSADRVLLAAVVVAAGLRFWGFASQSLWYDEWLTAEAASGTLRHLGWYVTEQAGIPPHVLLVHVGLGPRVRLQRCRAAAAVGAGRHRSGPRGLRRGAGADRRATDRGPDRSAARRGEPDAGLVLAGSPALQLPGASRHPVAAAPGRARRTGRRADLAWWSFVAALAIAVHYVAVFLVVIEVAVMLVGVRRPERKDLLVGSLPGALVLAALAPFGLQQFSERENHSWIAGFSLPGRLERRRPRGARRSQPAGPPPVDPDRAWPRWWRWGCWWLRGDRAERRAALVAGGFGMVPVALALVAAVAGVDMIVARYLIVVLAAAIGRWRSGWAWPACLGSSARAWWRW